jgi:beta-ribofuranosylaminobenzene 5'-phosphate synthase
MRFGILTSILGQSEMNIVVETGARIHMGLIDLARATDRAYGGIGFGIDSPATVLEAAPSSAMTLTGAEDIPVAHQQKIKSLLSILALRHPGTNTKFTLRTSTPIHSGFGSCTALLMSIAKAHSVVHGIDATPEVLQRITGRGGTSGIGLNVFFTGGVVRDGGRPWSEVPLVGPSSTASPATLPAMLSNYAFPEDWRIALLLSDGPQMAGRIEQQFFSDNIPSIAETLQVVSTVDSEIIPAIFARDFDAFQPAVARLGQIGFKAREISAQSASVKCLLADLTAHPAFAAGMSSFGPVLYAIWHKDKDGADLLSAVARSHSAQLLNAKVAQLGKGHLVYEQ